MESQVVMASKLEVSRQSVEALTALQRGVLNTRRAANDLRSQRGLLRLQVEQEASQAAIVQRTLNRLDVESQRGATVMAVTRFHVSGEKLASVAKLQEVRVDWWACRTPQDDANGAGLRLWDGMDGRLAPSVAVADSLLAVGEGDGMGGVQLGEATSARLVGVVNMPRFGVWTVTFSVTKPNPQLTMGPEGGSATDHVTMKFGASPEAMGRLPRVFNTRAKGRSDTAHTLHYQCTGAALYYEFEWVSSTEATRNHQIITIATVKEQQLPPVELKADNKTVVSDFVKRERTNAHQGGVTQGEALLAELIRVEEIVGAEQEADAALDLQERQEHELMEAYKAKQATVVPKTPAGAIIMDTLRVPPKDQRRRRRLQRMTNARARRYMDSQVLHKGVRQRFRRDDFFRTVKAHLSREVSIREADALDGTEAALASPPVLTGKDARRQASEQRYIARRAKHPTKEDLDAAQALVGEAIEVWSAEDAAWRMGFIRRMRVEPRNNNMSFHIMHLVRFYDFRALPDTGRAARRRRQRHRQRRNAQRAAKAAGEPYADKTDTDTDALSGLTEFDSRLDAASGGSGHDSGGGGGSDTGASGDEAGGNDGKSPLALVDKALGAASTPPEHSDGDASTDAASDTAGDSSSSDGPVAGAGGGDVGGDAEEDQVDDSVSPKRIHATDVDAIAAAEGVSPSRVAAVLLRRKANRQLVHTLKTGLETRVNRDSQLKQKELVAEVEPNSSWLELDTVQHTVLRRTALQLMRQSAATRALDLQQIAEADAAKRTAELRSLRAMDRQEDRKRKEALRKMAAQRQVALQHATSSALAQAEAMAAEAIAAGNSTPKEAWPELYVILRSRAEEHMTRTAEEAKERSERLARHKEELSMESELQKLAEARLEKFEVLTEDEMFPPAERRYINNLSEHGWTLEEAMAKAVSEFVTKFSQQSFDETEKEWDRRRAALNVQLRETRKQRHKEIVASQRRIRREERDAVEAQQGAVIAQRVAVRTALRIKADVWNTALPPERHCSHFHVKAWGDRYGTGRRCKTCGKEVGSHASGTVPEPPKPELLTEEDVIALGKEDAAVQEATLTFADRTVPAAIRRFDLRHRVGSALEDDAQVATARQNLEARGVAYQNLKLHLARIRTFSHRIAVLESEYLQLRTALDSCSQQEASCSAVERAHGDKMVLVGNEQAVCEVKLAKLREAEAAYQVSLKSMNEAAQRHRKADAKVAKAHSRTVQADLDARQQEGKVTDMYRWHDFISMEQRRADKAVAMAKSHLELGTSRYRAASILARFLQMAVKDSTVLTLFGRCKVVGARVPERLLILEPLWESRPATTRVYFPAMPCIIAEMADRELNQKEMEAEDMAARLLEQELRAAKEKEWAGMILADEEMKAHVAWEAVVKEEEDRLEGALAVAKARANKEVASDPFLQYTFHDQANEEAREEVALARLEHDQWDGVGFRTKVIKKQEQRQLQQFVMNVLMTEYVDDAVDNALSTHRSAYQMQRDQRRVVGTLFAQYHDMLETWIRQVVEETVAEGLDAQARAEAESGWALSERAPYPLYRRIKDLMDTRKLDLLKAYVAWSGTDEYEPDGRGGLQARKVRATHSVMAADGDMELEVGEVADDVSTASDSDDEPVDSSFKHLFETGNDDELAEDPVIVAGKEQWAARGLPEDDFSMGELRRIEAEEETIRYNEILRQKREFLEMRQADHDCRKFYAQERLMCQAERRLMLHEEMLMRDLAVCEAEVERLQRRGDMSEKMLRRYFVKRSVVARRKCAKESSIMALEDSTSAVMNEYWNEQWREKRERKLKSIEDRQSKVANEEFRFGAGGSEGATSAESTDEDFGSESEDDAVAAESAAARRLRRYQKAIEERDKIDTMLVVPDRESRVDVMRKVNTNCWEVGLRDAQDRADSHRRYASAVRKTFFEQQTKQRRRRREKRQEKDAKRAATRQELLALLAEYMVPVAVPTVDGGEEESKAAVDDDVLPIETLPTGLPGFVTDKIWKLLRWLKDDRAHRAYRVQRRLWLKKVSDRVASQGGDSRQWMQAQLKQRRVLRRERSERRLAAVHQAIADGRSTEGMRVETDTVVVDLPTIDYYSLSLEEGAGRVAAKAARAELQLLAAEQEHQMALKAQAVARHNATLALARTDDEKHAATDLRAAYNAAVTTLAKRRAKAAKQARNLAVCKRGKQKAWAILLATRSTCAHHDSSMLHNDPQRYDTRELWSTLNTVYFRAMVEGLAARAEAIATERRMRVVTAAMQVNRQEYEEKQVARAALQRAWDRKLRMRSRRSVLNATLFGKSRRRVLGDAFQSWFSFWRWHFQLRTTFEANAAVRKAVSDLGRVSAAEAADNAALPPPTMMQRLQRRWAECTVCHKRFSRSSNTSTSCAYHPGQYRPSCPSSCTKFESSCSLHYQPRWSCCDDTTEGYAGGCSFRWHTLPDGDPELDAAAERAAVAAADDDRTARWRQAEVDAAENRARLLRIGQRQFVEDTQMEARYTAALETFLKPG